MIPRINIVKEHAHWRLKGDLKILLLECRAKETTRYAINGICAKENKLISTDGRRLVEISIEHKIEVGNYYCSSDGFLLKTDEGKFPNYEDIIPKKGALRKIAQVTSHQGDAVTGLIFGKIIHAGCIVSLPLYRRPAEILERLLDGKIKAFVQRIEPANRPFIIEAETIFGEIRYIQMPINVINEIK